MAKNIKKEDNPDRLLSTYNKLPNGHFHIERMQGIDWNTITSNGNHRLCFIDMFGMYE